MIRNKKVWLPVLLSAFLHPLLSQTLFTYGEHSVDKKDFLTAFNRNPDTTGGRKKALEKYLELFINYKIKVQAAYDEKLNENSSFEIEADNFKKQIAESIINEEANEKALIKEAFERSKKDILVQQVFVEYGKDSAIAFQKIQLAWQQLKKGEVFDKVAIEFAGSEETKNSKGYLGYITVFTLPYEIENIIYGLPERSFSMPYKSQSGYHLFRRVYSRPASGARRVKQILLPFPPNATETDKQNISRLADTLYTRIKAGESFEELAKKYNTDNSSINGGVLPDINIGQYSSDFENKVFSLQQKNEITPPFETGYGYHIVKLVKIIPAGKNINETELAESLKQKTEASDRLAYAKQQLIKKWLLVTKYQKAAYDEKELSGYIDSSMNHSPLSGFKRIKANTVLFSFSKQKVVMADFLKYLQDNTSSKNRMSLLKDFTNQSCSLYYRNHLEEYSSVMRQQVKEFNEANLLFTAMDKHVWGKATDDTIGLRNYYNEHKAAYRWAPGVAGLIITADSRNVAEEVANKIRKNPGDWKNICGSYGTSVSADSGRYENNQLPVEQNTVLSKGSVSRPYKNNNDGYYCFLYITEVFNATGQRSLEEAKGMVTNDYQQVLEAKWLAALKKKYPVKVNREILIY